MIHLYPSFGFIARSHGNIPPKNEQEFWESDYIEIILKFIFLLNISLQTLDL